MGAPQLSTLRLYVVMDDGAEFTVQTRNPDMIRWDRTRAAKHWPPFQDAPFLGMTFLAWSALTREQALVMPWDEFETRCHACQEDKVETVDPTLGEVGEGS